MSIIKSETKNKKLFPRLALSAEHQQEARKNMNCLVEMAAKIKARFAGPKKIILLFIQKHWLAAVIVAAAVAGAGAVHAAIQIQTSKEIRQIETALTDAAVSSPSSKQLVPLEASGSSGDQSSQTASQKQSSSSVSSADSNLGSSADTGSSANSGSSDSSSSNSSSSGAGGASGSDSSSSSDSLSLAACLGSDYLTTAPLNASDYYGLVSLGNLSPSGHVFPTDHIYLYLINPSSHSTLYAPGNLTLTKISASQNITDGFTDYSLYFQPCSELTIYFLHVSSLSSDVSAALTPPFDWDNEYTTGGKQYRNYGKNVSLSVKAGDQIGTAGGNPGQNALDMGAYDTRVTLNFINPAARSNSTHTVCPIDYYSGSLKNTLMAKFGDYDGDPKRTTEPVCGTIDQDAAGTAQGIWLVKGTTKVSSEDPHLALVHNNIYPDKAVFSVGTSMSSSGLPARAFEFYPSDSGQVNRDFDDVRSDGSLYCYQLDGQGWVEGNFTIILQMPSSTTLKMEKQSAESCGSGPWAFGGNETEFER